MFFVLFVDNKIIISLFQKNKQIDNEMSYQTKADVALFVSIRDDIQISLAEPILQQGCTFQRSCQLLALLVPIKR